MKKQFLVLFIVAGLFSGISSCKKSSGNGAGSDGTMSGKVDGVLHTCNLAVEGSLNNDVLGLAGRWDGGGFTLAIPGFTHTEGVFNIGNSATAIFTAGLSATDTYSANIVMGTGKITIESFSDTNIKGSFEFTGYNTEGSSKIISDGNFDINY